MSARTRTRRDSAAALHDAALLDIAAEVLVADPSAPLSEVAWAAGIGRTTLHKHYATRDDLLRAVAHRALDRWEQVVAAADRAESDDGGLRALVEAMVPIGPQLAFLWRNPIFDHVEEIGRRWQRVESQALAVLKRAQGRGVMRADVADFWLLHAFHSLVYVAAESVGSGHLAPRDAPDLVVETFLRGLGPPQPST
ncbi:TetR/AcrR family transcriptional regulator [Planosporangium thailandense]|uniref:TetR/AcrR family transcriptional regulator n=1 Tax=Planosporangium thailandense TaxID=765197 RepID=A0ABX0Y539_9ACTN|nr:TetR/AcrR family transcriptional regulator [Planosporangium thailandense]NJC73529.1 TetR/AcrR family transcriptional regulator [Planosporangium thailandense]